MTLQNDSRRLNTFPALVSLTVESDSYRALPGYEAEFMMFNCALMTAFIQRCSCALRTLSLINLSMSDMNLIGFLHKTPSLVNLKVNEPWFTDSHATTFPSPVSPFFIQSLHVSHETSPKTRMLLPDLESLFLIVHASFDETRFARTINSRCLSVQGVSRLRRVRVHVGGMGRRLGTMLNRNKLEPLNLARKQGLVLGVYKTSIDGDDIRL